MSRRSQVKMDQAEILAFLNQSKTVICATNGQDGWPHLMPLWYIVQNAEIWSWTYAKSQKVSNLERDSRATLQIEDGTEYSKLRGVMFKTEVKIHRAVEQVADIGQKIFSRYLPEDQLELTEEVSKMVEAQAVKRVALQFKTLKEVSWDHRKLEGVY